MAKLSVHSPGSRVSILGGANKRHRNGWGENDKDKVIFKSWKRTVWIYSRVCLTVSDQKRATARLNKDVPHKRPQTAVSERRRQERRSMCPSSEVTFWHRCCPGNQTNVRPLLPMQTCYTHLSGQKYFPDRFHSNCLICTGGKLKG